jgi:hypothetical protein
VRLQGALSIATALQSTATIAEKRKKKKKKRPDEGKGGDSME